MMENNTAWKIYVQNVGVGDRTWDCEIASLRSRPLYYGTDILIANVLTLYQWAICLASQLG